jgi:hypothetical protein
MRAIREETDEEEPTLAEIIRITGDDPKDYII